MKMEKKIFTVGKSLNVKNVKLKIIESFIFFPRVPSGALFYI